jgi:small subunit ribosomal protein S17
MAKKNTEEIEETAVAEGAEAAEAGEASADEVKTEAAAEEAAAAEEPKAEAAPAEEKPKRAKKTALPKAATPSGEGEEEDRKSGKRAEKIGVVTSDKMTNTVVVRVDRLIKHPIYRKYVRKRKKFMAHDEKGAKIGDKVKIVETRPLSARKRWRVVEIIQKAEL